MKYNFGEHQTERGKSGKDIPVWRSPKFEESRAKACEILDDGRYNLLTSDFWILMNETKSGKMGYTGLIISHNGCLKINDKLETKFDPASVSMDKEGYNGSLVYTYCNKDQGIYEVGEVNARNCRNDYPYAMAYKRMFDRVVLKLSKLAYAGIYSEAESDSFRDPVDDSRGEAPEEAKPKAEQPKAAKPKPEEPKPAEPERTQSEAARRKEVGRCTECGRLIADVGNWSAEQIAMSTAKTFGEKLCWTCATKRKKASALAADATALEA